MTRISKLVELLIIYIYNLSEFPVYIHVYIHTLYGIKIDIYHNSICHGDLIHLILLLMTEWNTLQGIFTVHLCTITLFFRHICSVPVYDYIVFLQGIFAAWLGGWCNGMFPKGE